MAECRPEILHEGVGASHAPGRLASMMPDLLPCGQSLVSLRHKSTEDRIMAKGSMKAKKEARKPKKDAKKPAAAPALKPPPVMALRQKEK